MWGTNNKRRNRLRDFVIWGTNLDGVVMEDSSYTTEGYKGI